MASTSVRQTRTRQTRFELLALELAKRGHRCGSEVATLVNGAFQAADGREFREREKTVEVKTSQSGGEANNFTWSRVFQTPSGCKKCVGGNQEKG